MDTGKTGPDKGDKMRLDLFGGRFDGYKCSGTLAGGNFTYTRELPAPISIESGAPRRRIKRWASVPAMLPATPLRFGDQLPRNSLWRVHHSRRATRNYAHVALGPPRIDRTANGCCNRTVLSESTAIPARVRRSTRALLQ